ncbi:BTB/POZ/MATH-domains containing protein [Tanacetum coccineum]
MIHFHFVAISSETGSDIVFRVKDDTFKAHKVILAARSPVFKAQLYRLVRNPALDEVELMDIEPLVFKAMILFISSDKLPDSYESMDSMSHMIQHLLVAADHFGLDRLKQLCEVKLCEELNMDVVGTTLSLAHDHHCSQLKACCMDFAVANLRGIFLIITAGNAPGKSSYANITGKPSGKKVNVRTLFTPGGNGIDVVVSVDSIRAISERFANTAYGFFLGKKVAYPVAANYVRNT